MNPHHVLALERGPASSSTGGSAEGSQPFPCQQRWLRQRWAFQGGCGRGEMVLSGAQLGEEDVAAQHGVHSVLLTQSYLTGNQHGLVNETHPLESGGLCRVLLEFSG